MRNVAQPVAVLTASIPSSSGTNASTHNHGATLSSFTSVSLHPLPLVSFSLRLPSRLADLLNADHQSTRFQIHLLSRSQEHLARTFARQPQAGSTSTLSSTHIAPSSSPFEARHFDSLRENACGSLTCRLLTSVSLDLPPPGSQSQDSSPGVTSQLFVAAVDKIDVPSHTSLPLLYYRQKYFTTSAEPVGPSNNDDA
jgi:flavin reductase (DIM6/NTAB) family NADH-FMN oxidoreductase RutF